MRAAEHGDIDKLVAISHKGIDVTTACNEVSMCYHITYVAS